MPGLPAYKRGDYATAMRELRSLAKQGNATAQQVAWNGRLLTSWI